MGKDVQLNHCEKERSGTDRERFPSQMDLTGESLSAFHIVILMGSFQYRMFFSCDWKKPWVGGSSVPGNLHKFMSIQCLWEEFELVHCHPGVELSTGLWGLHLP